MEMKPIPATITLPLGWRQSSVMEIAAKRPNATVGGPFGSDLVAKDYVDFGVPVIRGQNMGGHHVSGEFAFVTPAKAKALQSNLARPSDLVFTQRGTLGQVAVVPPTPYEAYLISQSQMKLAIDSEVADPVYVYQYFASEFGQKQILDSAIQTGVPHTNLGILRSYSMPLPQRLDEQRSIAEALTDTDGLIEVLGQLLTKKRLIKQGAMQELLTGKRRLPGFSDPWEEISLGELADVRSGGTPSTRQPELWDGGIPWCTPTDITALAGAKHIAETERSISEKGQKASSAEMLPAGTVVMTSRATIGECAIASVPLTTNQGFKNFIPRRKTSGEFLYYLLGTQKTAFLALCSGSTFLEIGKRQLENFVVRCPVEFEEQIAIADVLSCMDAELAALESRLAKARALKQAMAQSLLTGRIRLVEPAG